MRDSLTVLAILLIGVLTAALVGPYVIDWDSHRALIERKLSDAIGTPVKVAGAIDLKLLPTPVFRFGGVVIGDGRAGRPRLSAAALDAELSLTALMRGEVQVVDTTLIQPRLDIVQAPDGTVDLALPSDATADRVAIDHLGIRDGTLVLVLGDGRRETLTGLELDAEATSLRGPFKAAGRVGDIPFRLATGSVDRGRVRMKLHLDGATLRPSLDLDGTLTGQRPGAAGPGFDGSVVAAGQLPLDGTPATVPWRLTAHLAADRDAAAASEVEVRAGADMRALIAGGDGAAAYAAGSALPKVALHLHGATLDVDDLAVAPSDSSVVPPKGTDLARLMLRFAGDGAGLVSAPLHLDVSAAFDTATLGGQTSLGTSLSVGIGPDPTVALALSVDGPDGTQVKLDGRVDPGPVRPVAGPFGAGPAVATAAVFRGEAAAQTLDLRRAAAWLQPVMPGVAGWLIATVPGRSVAAAGAIEASSTGVAARDVRLRIDGSTFGGALSFTQTVGADRARLFADLSSDALDLDRLPDLSGAAEASRALDLDLALSASTITLVHPSNDAALSQPITAGQVALRLTKRGDAVKLERLSLDVGGARLDATGSRSGGDAEASAHVSAPELGPLVETLASLMPSPAAALLRTRAAALSPMEATLHVDAAAVGEGGLAPTHVTLGGTAGETRFDAALAPEGPLAERSADTRPIIVSLRADAPDAGPLLRQIGVSPVGSGLGAVHVEGEGRGTLTDGFTTKLRATLGGTALSYTGRAQPTLGAGRLTVTSGDIDPILAAFALAPVEAAIPADVAADIRWDDGTVEAASLSGTIGGSAARGALSLDRTARRPGDTTPILRGHLALDRMPAATLLASCLGSPAEPTAGTAWSTRPFAPSSCALPRSEVALTIDRLPLRGALEARGMAMTLKTGGGALTLSDAAGQLGGGPFGGTLTLRRDGPGATLSGHVAWAGIPIDVGGVTGRIGGTQDFAGTGGDPASLVASLGGSGSLSLVAATLARTDPAAPARTAAAFAARDAAVERGSEVAEPTPIDPEAVRRAVSAELDHGPLLLGDATVPATLAAGVLRTAPLHVAGLAPLGTGAGQGQRDTMADWTADTVLTLELGRSTVTARTVLGGRDNDGAVVTRTGPVGGDLRREVDVTGVVETLQTQAIARAQDRIDIMEQDIRERAAFNRRLKAIQADQQAARERAEAEKRAAAEAQKAALAAQKAAAEAQKKAAADAARQKAEEGRLQAQVQSAARADAAAKEEAERQRFIDHALNAVDPPLDRAAHATPLVPPRRPGPPAPDGAATGPSDPPPPPSIVQERGGAEPPAPRP